MLQDFADVGLDKDGSERKRKDPSEEQTGEPHSCHEAKFIDYELESKIKFNTFMSKMQRLRAEGKEEEKEDLEVRVIGMPGECPLLKVRNKDLEREEAERKLFWDEANFAAIIREDNESRSSFSATAADNKYMSFMK